MENYLEDGRNKLLRNVGTNLHGVQRNEIFKKANGITLNHGFNKVDPRPLRCSTVSAELPTITKFFVGFISVPRRILG